MDGQKFLTEFLEAGRATVAQDEDGFVTLTDKKGNTYVANTNESEKERYKETGKKLSQVKKEEKAKKEQEQKEAKKTEEKKKPESEKKGGAEVIELHPEKAKKYSFTDFYGNKKEGSKEDIDKTISDINNDIKDAKRYIKDYAKDIRDAKEEMADARKAATFWEDYKEKGGDQSPEEFLNKNFAKYNILNREDQKEIADKNIWPERVVAKIAAHERRHKNALETYNLSKSETENWKKKITKCEAKIAELKALAQDSLDTFLKNISVEER